MNYAAIFSYVLGGADVGNYALVAPSDLGGRISQAALKLTGLKEQSEGYDATGAVYKSERKAEKINTKSSTLNHGQST